MRPHAIFAAMMLLAAAPGLGQTPPDDPPPADPPPVRAAGEVPIGPPASATPPATAPTTGPAAATEPAATRPYDPIRLLLEEIDRLNEQVVELRQQLAAARLESAAAERELGELRRFIEDRDDLGEAFREYRGVREVAERDVRQRQADENRQRVEQQRAERLARMQDARSRRQQERAERERVESYRRRGFAPLGLDVFLSKMAYSYHAADATASRIDYVSGIGNYLRLYPGTTVDFSRMTISGSVLNAAETTRDLGVAVAFFDEAGTQVGHEIIQVRNARPDVPYPFTSTIEMALDRPFTSSTQYVLYADPMPDADGE